jgi:uncharacterized protein
MKKLLPLFLLLVAPVYAANVAPETPFICVSGTAKMSVAPDEASLSFSMMGRADNYADALKSTDARFADFLAFLTAQKIPKDSVTSYEINVRLVYQDRLDSSPADGATSATKPVYIASRDVKLLLKDLTQYPAVYDKILALETEDRVSVEFKTTKEDELKKKLLLEAAANARQKAQDLCDSFGMKVESVHAISEQSFQAIENIFIPYDDRSDDSGYAGAGGGGRQREYLGPKTLDCTSDVTVIFTIVNKN